MSEQWKDIKGYEGIYQVSTLGRVRRLAGEIETERGKRYLPVRIKKAILVDGYLYYTLYINDIEERCAAHRLVAAAFIPNPENKPHVNHLNGDKTDNRAENLEWCTRSENMRHALATGLWKQYDRRGEKNPMFGKHHSADAKQKIADVHRGTHHSEETKRKMSETRHKMKLSETHKQRIGENARKANTGRKWIHKGGTQKFVKPEEFQQYLDDGWEQGKIR